MRYRVEQLAAVCDVSVDTVRFYQSRGLVPQPVREGRVAWYEDAHADRIRRIRELQRKGLTLAAIARVVEGDLGPTDADLAAAVAVARGVEGAPAVLTLEELSVASGVPTSLIQAVEREGIAIGRRVDGKVLYSAADAEVMRTALRLLEFGLPLGDLLSLAREANTAMVVLAARAVELFDEHVRKPIRDTAGSDEAAAAELVSAFAALLPAVTDLIANHFRRVLLAAAEEKLA